MGMYKYIRQTWEQPASKEIIQARFVQWRKEPATIRLEHPTRLDRARSLGYRAKEGIIVVRQRVIRGGRQRPKFKSVRRPKTMRRKKILTKSYQWVCEMRAQKKYPNCEVLNSYFVGKDGLHFWYEIILVDKAHPAIIADKNLGWISTNKHKGRVFRGKTSSGRRSSRP